MKKLSLFLTLFLLLLISPSAWGSISFVQSQSNSATTGTTVVVTITTTASDQLVLCTFETNSITISSISSANTWTQQASIAQGTGRTECWTSPISSAAETSVTVNYSGTITDAAVIISEYSGALSYGNTNTATNASTTTQTISVTTQDNNNFIVAGLGIPTGSTVTIQNGTKRKSQAVGATQLWAVDNTSATPASVTDSTTTAATHPYSAAAVELRTSSGAAVIGSVLAGSNAIVGPNVRQ